VLASLCHESGVVRTVYVCYHFRERLTSDQTIEGSCFVQQYGCSWEIQAESNVTPPGRDIGARLRLVLPVPAGRQVLELEHAEEVTALYEEYRVRGTLATGRVASDYSGRITIHVQ
jgi:hypothetical protein